MFDNKRQKRPTRRELSLHVYNESKVKPATCTSSRNQFKTISRHNCTQCYVTDLHIYVASHSLERKFAWEWCQLEGGNPHFTMRPPPTRDPRPPSRPLPRDYYAKCLTVIVGVNFSRICYLFIRFIFMVLKQLVRSKATALHFITRCYKLPLAYCHTTLISMSMSEGHVSEGGFK